MSVKVSSWVWHEVTEEVNGNDLILLLALADVADDSGRCRFMDDESDMTYDAIGSKARVSKSTVIRIVARLRELGLIDHRKGVKGRPNEFRVLVPWTKKSGVNMTPNGFEGSAHSVSSGDDSVSNPTTFGVKPDSHSSIDVLNVRERISSSHASGVDVEFSDDVKRLCDLLADLVRANGHKVDTVGKLWWGACDRLIRIDGYSAEQIEILARWATSDEFWAANIRSMSKFRKQFSTLRAQRNRQLERKKPNKNQRALDVVMMGRRLQAQSEQLAVGE